ncbi:flagellar export protein FliJ [[Clostridium] fimetarium]|uniref:Flagellar FliJ protein n=1 Tax=[Clostridium] fimetarium TaxID=99656 RepID=A0A1I0N112_9FIRM|nr:flagellar export protein FliJ [[Clostridium] fimetarium]SEV94712.1 flagellar export protein FliJ [[Clostridium] fimetarium]
MAKFLYKLQNILSIKVSLETQSKTAYAEASNKFDAEESKLKNLIQKRLDYEEQYRQLSKAILDIPAIQRCNSAIDITKDMIKKQMVTVKVAEKNLDLARNRLNSAMKERKTYEKLKENSFEVFMKDLNSEEKKEIDELVSFNYNDNIRETGE